MENCDVAIIGAGPYGLSTAAYLQQIKGLDVRVFGKPMDFWERCMPPRMLLRSHWHATHIAHPKDRLTLSSYAAATNNPGLGEPIPVSEFIQYGRWYGCQGRIPCDQRNVMRVSLSTGRFKVTLDDGAVLRARRVVIATGIEPFASKPPAFREIPSELACHSSELRDYSVFKDKEVAVIGGGQSALESGAFLHENGARVEILVRQPTRACRRPRFSWLGNPFWMRLLRGRGDVGPVGISLIIQHPSLYARLPRRLQTKWDRRAIKLGFSYRLAPELNSGAIRPGLCVDLAEAAGGRLRLQLSDDSERIVDYAVLATGYRIDVTQCAFWGRGILDNLALVDGYPRLDRGLESSVPGLHFVGAMAAYSFGPLMRFVSGTGFAASSVAQRIRSRAKQDARSEVALHEYKQTSEGERLSAPAPPSYLSATEFSNYETAHARRHGQQAD